MKSKKQPTSSAMATKAMAINSKVQSTQPEATINQSKFAMIAKQTNKQRTKALWSKEEKRHKFYCFKIRKVNFMTSLMEIDLDLIV
jgi:hypothetical protein